MKYNKRLTQRNFGIIEFKDLYSIECSLQKSSLATDDAIWIGCDHEIIHHVTKEPCGARMHLNRDMAKVIGETLLHFSETGEIPECINFKDTQ